MQITIDGEAVTVSRLDEYTLLLEGKEAGIRVEQTRTASNALEQRLKSGDVQAEIVRAWNSLVVNMTPTAARPSSP